MREFLRTQQLAVIATSSAVSGPPESVLIAFVEDEELRIYFQTGQHTRKAWNIEKNPAVSLVIGLQLSDMTIVQYEGIARQLIQPKEIISCKRRFPDKKSSTTKEYLEKSTTIFYEITPTWIGYSDYHTSTPRVFELSFS